ncbi:MAG TPA: PilZ domain-containing protein [Thermoanaerobaculia bacterium]|nr:PilZ domain-containing protein [Thermoanaerobaculia bacterium]
MEIEVAEVRKNARFVLVQPLTGTFGPLEASILDVSIGGAKLEHAQSVRIGTAGKFSFKIGDVTALVQGKVIWSQMIPTPAGLVYRTGIQLQPDPTYALAVNSLFKSGMAVKDAESLERKKQRLIEREQERASKKMRMIPTAGGME